jgi:hypothetical protein
LQTARQTAGIYTGLTIRLACITNTRHRLEITVFSRSIYLGIPILIAPNEVYSQRRFLIWRRESERLLLRVAEQTGNKWVYTNEPVVPVLNLYKEETCK